MKLKTTIIAAATAIALSAGTFSATASASWARYSIGMMVGHSATSTGTVDITKPNAPGIYNNDYDFLEGETVIITATPGPGSVLYSFEIPTFGYSVYPNTTEPFSYTFEMPASEVIIDVDFRLAPKTPTTPTTPEPTPTPEPEPTPTPEPNPTPTPEPTPTEPTTPTTPITPQYKKGDINGDGLVNAADATLILKHCVQIITLDTEQLDRADVNGDGRVNAADATMILKMLVGLA